MSFLDLQNEFYRPLWIRIVLLGILFGWGLFEFATGAPFWGVIFCGVGMVALWQWFLSAWPEKNAVNNNPPGSKSDDADSGNHQ